MAFGGRPPTPTFLATAAPIPEDVPIDPALINATPEIASAISHLQSFTHLYLPLSCNNTWVWPNSHHTSIWAKPDQPKKQSIAVVPGLVRISNNDLFTSG